MIERDEVKFVDENYKTLTTGKCTPLVSNLKIGDTIKILDGDYKEIKYEIEDKEILVKTILQDFIEIVYLETKYYCRKK